VQKADKLKKYQKAAYRTILLLENNDLANMSFSTMVGAIEDAYPEGLPDGVDRIWFADTSIPESRQFFNLTPASRSTLPIMTATEELDHPPE